MVKQAKNKQSVLFTIHWTKSIKTTVTPRMVKIFRVIVLLIIVSLPFGLFSGVYPFIFNTVRCGQFPVESNTFMAAYTYRLPGDEGYGISAFSDYQYCTQAEIQATNGYHRDLSTKAGKEEESKIWAQIHEAQRFSTSKLNFTFYTPKLEGYSVSDLRVDTIHSNVQAFYTIKKGNTVVAGVRELKKNDDYNICLVNDPNQRYCKVIGVDSAGRTVRREYNKGVTGWTSYYVGTDIGDTGIIFSTQDDQEAIILFGSMSPTL